MLVLQVVGRCSWPLAALLLLVLVLFALPRSHVTAAAVAAALAVKGSQVEAAAPQGVAALVAAAASPKIS